MKNITLQFDAAPAVTEQIAGWSADTYVLSGTTRGAAAPTQLELDPDTVLEIELENGTRLLVAAEDAGRYLGEPQARGDGAAGTIRVGSSLRLSGANPPAAMTRDGVFAWVLKALRVFKAGPVGMTAVVAAGTFQDRQLENRVGLYRCATERWELSRVDTLPAYSEPALLFLHGTASSTAGSFGGLWADKYRSRLAAAYGERIYGFEHRSLTESPIANALDLVCKLPQGARLHLVSHSRGGMVGELLARANRCDAPPFAAEEIARFVAATERAGNGAYAEDGQRLAELGRELKARAIRVERFVRVACPVRGTTLASGRLDRWASVMHNLLGKGMNALGGALPAIVPVVNVVDQLTSFLLAVVRERTDARILPGLEAMMPESPLVALLNAPGVEVEPPVHVLAGDFDGNGLLAWLGDCLSEAFYGGQTDLVVNTPSMSGGAARRRGIWQKSVAGPEVTHFSYFRRDESALSLLEALAGADESFEPLPGPSRQTISRGGKRIKARADAPIAFLLPGIMGSHIELDGNRIWFDPFNLIAGDMQKLRIDAAGQVAPDGWMDRSYERLAEHLAETHELRPFAYDWRLSITAAAAAFGKAFDDAMSEAEKRKKPLRIVAHSMGGLVARLALNGNDRWTRLKANPGSRLLQLGTPNCGSHSIAAVLLGRDDFVQMIERWFDWRHDMREFLGIVRDFPGVLELLPWPGAGGEVDYFDPAHWEQWFAEDADAKNGRGWQPPQKSPLQAARAAVNAIAAAPVDPECTVYVAGSGETPVGVRIVGGRVEIAYSREGDGRVPWKTGIPPGVRVWYVDAAHGDLANHESAFPAYLELIESGRSGQLPQTPPSARGATEPQFRPRAICATPLYPTPDELLAAALGGSRPRRSRAAGVIAKPALFEVVNGTVAGAEAPVLIGAYAHESLRGSAHFLDRHLGGRLRRAHATGRYPCQPTECAVFLNPNAGAKPGGAVVVGLGAVGELVPGALARALASGLLEYARVLDQQGDRGDGEERAFTVSALLVGSGYGGLDVPVAVRCLAEAVCQTNRALELADRSGGADSAGSATTGWRVGRVRIFDEIEDRAIAVTESLAGLVREPRFVGRLAYFGAVSTGEGAYRARCETVSGNDGWYRIHITTRDDGSLCFTLVGDRARNEAAEEPNQRQAVDGLIRAATNKVIDQPGLSRALFELMVPNGMKEAVADLRGIVLAVDAGAAVFPWELMRDAGGDSEPLAARVGVVRQLASSYGRGCVGKRVPTVGETRAFVVGDTDSGLVELPGAQEEAKTVANLLGAAGYQVVDICRADAQTVFVNLFDGSYRIVHLAGHGVVASDGVGETGMVLGPEIYLTAAQVAKLRRAPEFVFINCCHLGSMDADTKPRWGELASGLATTFIEMGCKAVIAAGWAVDDAAANLFSRTFYERMLAGDRFGDAVLAARSAVYRRYPAVNTWGAYQAYGDERYRFVEPVEQEDEVPAYVHQGQVEFDLDRLVARLKGATEAEREIYRRQLKNIEKGARARHFGSAAVRERLAMAWADLDDKDKAIEHYRAALDLEDASFSLHSLEQLANLESRHGEALLKSTDEAKRQHGEALMQLSDERLDCLLRLGKTVERLSLRASGSKRRARSLRGEATNAAGKKHLRKQIADTCNAYWRASDEAQRRNGHHDYYPLLNALDESVLAAAWGNCAFIDAHRYELPGLLAAAVDGARRRYAAGPALFHAVAEVDAARVAALLASLDTDAAETITTPGVADRLAERYCDVLHRLGSAREADSVTCQLEYLRTMLPEDDLGRSLAAALQVVIVGVERGMQLPSRSLVRPQDNVNSGA